ncbi:MAG: type II toxin-antitoxin system PemK/MazF family toxin [Burkholderiales bacterium]|nr:type II toxin-antitoxin system PemK/MazF family toxin [Burkholderiales bacterium]
MIRRQIPCRGDIYWIDPNPVAGREMKDRHRFVVITPREINALGTAMTVPITGGGAFARDTGLTVPITGHDTTGVAVCNQVRSFDLQARVGAGTARYVETLDTTTAGEIVARVLSVIDPAG